MPETLQVIVVDDEPDVADAFALLIEQLGHEAETAPSGPEALEMLEGWHPDVAFVDLGMSEMDGFEVAERIRRRDAPAPLLVALTGYGRAEDRQKAVEHGFHEHLVKPPDIDDVLAILESAGPSDSRPRH